MSDMREDFESWAAKEVQHLYLTKKGDTGEYVYKTADIAYRSWKAARAQGGQGAKPIGFTWDAGRFGRQFTADAGVADRVRVDGVAVSPVYTQPQPAVPDTVQWRCRVRRDWTELKPRPFSDFEKQLRNWREWGLVVSSPDGAEQYHVPIDLLALLSTTTTPQSSMSEGKWLITGETLYVRLAKDLSGGPDETFVDIEDGNGNSVRIERFEDGNDWIIGPLYEAPKVLYNPTTPQADGWVLMPEELTAENGAKSLLMSEFHEVVELECGACDADDEDCVVCGGNGSYTYRVPVSWPTIKSIYRLAVEKLKRPQPPANKAEQAGGEK